jgi:hypothetical protein
MLLMSINNCFQKERKMKKRPQEIYFLNTLGCSLLGKMELLECVSSLPVVFLYANILSYDLSPFMLAQLTVNLKQWEFLAEKSTACVISSRGLTMSLRLLPPVRNLDCFFQKYPAFQKCKGVWKT